MTTLALLLAIATCVGLALMYRAQHTEAQRRPPQYADATAAAAALEAVNRTTSPRDRWTLRAHPGWTARLDRRLRRNRRVAARLYFDQVESQYRCFIRAALDATPEAVPQALIAHSVRFRCLLALARLQLSLPCALQPGTRLLRAATAAAGEMAAALRAARIDLEQIQRAPGTVG